MLNFLKAIENDGEDYDLYNYGQEATAESVLNSIWGKGDYEMLQDVSASAIGDLVAAVELFNEVNGTNYDGIILPTETVTFNSEQAKLTSNVNPTVNEDIRYSDRDFSYAELTSKDDLKGIVVDKNQQVKLTSNGSIDAGWVVSEVKKKCDSVTTNPNITTYYTNVPDIGRNVEVTKTGIVHSFFSSVGNTKKPSPRDLINARVSLEIPQILQNSIEVNHSVRSGNIDVPYSHIMMGTVALEDANGNLEYYAVRSVIEERTNQDPILAEAEVLGKLYAINAKKVGTPNAQVTNNGVALTYDVAYTYNIAQFLEDVKLKFDDTFSEDVYKNLGMTRKQNKFSNHLLFSGRETEYTEQEYRDYGWARANGILNEEQNADYRSKFADAVSGHTKFNKSKRGEYIIPVSDIYDSSMEGIDNVLVFAKGTIDKPVITSIIEIYEYDETNLDITRRNIYDLERRGIQQTVGETFGRYDAVDFATYYNGEYTQGSGYDNGDRFGRSNREQGEGIATFAERDEKVRLYSDRTDTSVYDVMGERDRLLKEKACFCLKQAFSFYICPETTILENQNRIFKIIKYVFHIQKHFMLPHWN